MSLERVLARAGAVVVALERVHPCAANWDSSAVDGGGLRLKKIGHLWLKMFKDFLIVLLPLSKSHEIWT